MAFFEKRKNDAPRGWRMLLIGFVVGVVVTLLVAAILPQVRMTSEVVESQPDAALTATTFIQGATGTAHVILTSQAQSNPPVDMDPLYLTATAIVQQATQQAASSS